MSVPSNLKYTKSHEWVETEGEALGCGITDYAQKEISDVVFVEVPAVGKTVTKGESIAVVESVKAAFDIYAPVSGEIVEANSDLESDPGMINEDSYGKGWLFKIKPTNTSDLDELMDINSYEAHVASEAH